MTLALRFWPAFKRRWFSTRTFVYPYTELRHRLLYTTGEKWPEVCSSVPARRGGFAGSPRLWSLMNFYGKAQFVEADVAAHSRPSATAFALRAMLLHHRADHQRAPQGDGPRSARSSYPRSRNGSPGLFAQRWSDTMASVCYQVPRGCWRASMSLLMSSSTPSSASPICNASRRARMSWPSG